MARDEIQAILEELKTKKSSVPERAVAFHSRAQTIIRDIEQKLSSRWGPAFLSKSRQDETALKNQAHEMLDIVRDLTVFMNFMTEMEQRCHQLTLNLSPRFPDLADAVDQFRRAWLDRLRPLCRIDGKLALDSERREDPNDSADRTDIIGADLLSAENFVRLFGLLNDDVKKSAARKLDVTTFEDLTRRARGEFIRLAAQEDSRVKESAKYPRMKASGPTMEQTIVEMEKYHQVAMQVLNAPPPSPPEAPAPLRKARVDIADIREWAKALDTEFAADLVDRLRNVETPSDWSRIGEIEAISEDAARELARLKKMAEERRGEERLSLGQDVRYYEAAVPEKYTEMNQILEELDRRSVDSLHSHKDWLHTLKDARKEFESRALTKTAELKRYLAQRAEQLAKQTDEVATNEEGMITEELRQDIQRLKASIEAHGKAHGRDSILISLRATSGDEIALGKLIEQAQADRDLFHSARIKREELAAASKAMGIPFEISAMASFSRRRVDDLQVAVQREEEQFLRIATEKIHREWREQEDLRDALRETDSTFTAPNLEPPSALSTPSEAATAWTRLTSSGSGLKERVETLITHLSEELKQHGTKLLDTKGLSTDEKSRADDLLLAIRNQEAALEPTLAGRLRSLSKNAQGCRDFLDRQTLVQRNVEKFQRDVRDRLRQLRENDLRHYFSYYGKRLVWLLHGASRQKQDWDMAKHQIKAAQDLLEKMFLHAERLAARELHEMCAAAVQRKRLASGAETAQIDRLLEEIQRHNTSGDLAPVSTRRALRAALQRGANA